MSPFQYRVVDTAGGEIGIISLEQPAVGEDSVVTLPNGQQGTVVDVYDDENGREGGVIATLVVEEF